MADSARRNDTAAKIVINQAEIAKFGDPSVLDVMKRLPGLTVSDSSVRMRGLGNGYTQILLNGERPPAGFSLDSLAPDMVERIEIIRAATAEFSTQSIAGTVNIVLKKAVAKASREIKSGVGAGPGSRSQQLNLAMSNKIDAFSYTLGATLLHQNAHLAPVESVDRRDAAGKRLQQYETRSDNDNAYTAVNLNARLNWKLDGIDSVTWQTFVADGRAHGAGEQSTSTSAGQRHPYAALQTSYFGNTTSVRSDVSWVAGIGGTGRLDTKIGVALSDNQRGLFRVARNDAATPVLDRDYVSDIQDEGLSWSGKLSMPWARGHALGIGWDTGHNRRGERENQVDRVPPGNVPFDFDNGFDARITRVALYAQDEWDISPAWSIYLGMRGEAMRSRTSGAGIPTSRSQLQVLSPLAQTLWKVPGAKGDQLRLALTRTFKAPELSRMVPRHFYTSFNTEISPDFTGNPRLKPELARGVDFAYEHYWAEGALVSASASVREIEGLIRGEVAYNGGRWVAVPQNLGTAHVRGIELESKFPLKAVMDTAAQVDLRASVSRNWSRVEGVPGPDNRLNGQPRWSANFGADYAKGAWSGGASLALVAGGWTRDALYESKLRSAQRALEAYAVHKFGPRSQLRFTVLNLLKVGQSGSARYADPYGSVQSDERRAGYVSWRAQHEYRF
ncbi:TonB-dependent receptor plug domain-containing protein [Pseudoduganella namucuonensis]|uniref:Outer membrane receptor proteins, mostly Fe transport n=1 Tax=Pseudoduganella namucuonensis TaxID=1035707 RepID=A0A1I7KVL1_9BURK|nr:TonB-dependent receptor [Pseudoduganella namucuonensis]SFV01513.1 Outer membrane receptor proteins, mostly Fe transport [Pseudoduganella namucuonensis]